MGSDQSKLRPKHQQKKKVQPADGSIAKGYRDKMADSTFLRPPNHGVTAGTPQPSRPTSFVKPDLAPLCDDEDDIANLRKMCPHIRILVVGKADTGKMAILQKICDTTEGPIIHDRNGNLVNQSATETADGRGANYINNELVFARNNAFVFHDHLGFETGSEAESEEFYSFIAQREEKTNHEDRLHAIWYCISKDHDQPLSDAEMNIFAKGTGTVPVIVIFTSRDANAPSHGCNLLYSQGVGGIQCTSVAKVA